MPRSSKHKSSKHSSRDGKDHTDSEKESSLKERKAKEETSARPSKESGAGDKRKLDPKDKKEYYDSVDGEYFEEYASSKRRKEKFDDCVNDRWNGGEDDSSKKSKASSIEKSRRRGGGEAEETKKSSSQSEGKHRESSRRESREFDRDRERDRDRDRDRERKCKEAKTERSVDGEDPHGSKMVSDKTDLNAEDQLQGLESENYLERRARRKRGDYSDADKHQESTEDFSDRPLSSRDDGFKDGRQEEDKHKDEKYRDKYREGIDRENKHRSDKQRDDRSARGHAYARSEEKLSQDEKEASDKKRKNFKPQGNDREHAHDRGQEHGHERNSEHDGYRVGSREHEREYDRGRDRERERRDYERDRYHDRSRDRDRDLDRERNRDRGKDCDRDYNYDRDLRKSELERDYDREGSYLDDQGVQYKDRRERKRSPDDNDDLSDTKSRAAAPSFPDTKTKSDRAVPDGERIRYQSREASSLQGGEDENRHMKEANNFSGGSNRGLKHRTPEKSTKMVEGHLGELSAERSSSAKASPMSLVERSSSSTSLERRPMNRITTRCSLDTEETVHRRSGRDFSASEDRVGQELPSEKPVGDESSQTELSFYNKSASQNNSSFPPRLDSRVGVGSPSVGSLEEDNNRVSIGSRYKRNNGSNMARGQGNAWRGTPNWPSPIPNGFIPFPHGPPHGGFQSMMPQFPSPSLFGVRPSMEMGHPGIPYHMPDAERFSSHLRPLGWQNMIDGSGPSPMHSWDVSNSVFRDEQHIYGGPEWDHNRNRIHGRGWESGGAEAWKTQNGDAYMDVSSKSQKDDDDVAAGQTTSHSENNQAKSVEAGSNVSSPAKELSKPSPNVVAENPYDYPTPPAGEDAGSYCGYYLSKLDISVELTGPELYSECIGLLVKDESATVDKETAVLVNLKDGGKAVPKSFTPSLTPLLFPAAKNSVFQRAMELYKNQRVELNGVPIGKVGKADDKEDEKGEDTVSPQQKHEILATAYTEMETDEHVSALGHDSSPDGLEVPTQEITMISNGNPMNASIIDSAVSEDTASGGSEAVVPSATDDDNKGERNNHSENENNNNTMEYDEDTEACGEDAARGPLVIQDASLKVSRPLIPTHESESVLSSRIHHSPENTH